MVVIFYHIFGKLSVIIFILELCSLLKASNQLVMDSKSVLLVQEKQKKLQSVLSELVSIAEETKAAEEGAIARRNLAEKSQTEYEKLTAEELMQIAYSRDSALRADSALNKVLSDEESINDFDKKVFELKLKNTQLKKKLLRTENELANAQIQYITTRNQTLYTYNNDKDNSKIKSNNGLEFLNHLNNEQRRDDLFDQVSLMNSSNIISDPKALRRNIQGEMTFDSSKDGKYPTDLKTRSNQSNLDRSNVTASDILNSTLQQAETNNIQSLVSDGISSDTNINYPRAANGLDSIFPYNMNLFPSYNMNNSTGKEKELEKNSASSFNDNLTSYPWEAARFNPENNLDTSMSMNPVNGNPIADAFVNNEQLRFDGNSLQNKKNITDEIVAALFNNRYNL